MTRPGLTDGRPAIVLVYLVQPEPC